MPRLHPLCVVALAAFLLSPASANAQSLSVQPAARAQKLHPALLTNDIPAWAIVERERDDAIVAMYVLFHADVNAQTDGVRVCERHGAHVRSILWSINALVIELPADEIGALADEASVQWIEPPLPALGEHNDGVRVRTGANIVQAAPYGLDGTGVTVLVYDSGTAKASHPDFGGRLHVRDASGTKVHSSHVAGTIGGSGAASSGTYKGMAPNVTLESYGFQMAGGIQPGYLYTDPGDLQNDYNQAINTYGADLANNSIGANVEMNGFDCAWQGDYGITGALLDAIVCGSLGKPFPIVWSVGNEREGSRCDVEGYGDYYSITPPACAKNPIVVGAVNSNDDTMTATSSWGPTDDGRIKPDLVAPGCQNNGDFGVTSCNATTGYTTLCSSSMATATVTGLCALLIQDYRAHDPNMPDPLNSTLKALLAHTAADQVATDDNRGPDYRFGYGSVRIKPAVDLLRSGSFVEAELAQGEVYTVEVRVGPADTELKVTLAWDDPAGTPGVSPVLVNDLDLRVLDSASGEYLPWTLDPLNPSAPAVRTAADHLNNIEQVVIDAPPAGVYQVEVYGYNVPQGPQSFSLCATPELLRCSALGTLTLDRPAYTCTANAVLWVTDCDLNTDDLTIDTVAATIASDTEPAGETVLLTESAPDSGIFVGTIPLAETNDADVLWVTSDDTITATYVDADDGQGGTNVAVTADALVDCVAPEIDDVTIADVEPYSAIVTLASLEPALYTVRYDIQCGPLDLSQTGVGFQMSEEIALTGLDPNMAYFFDVLAEDAAGNVAQFDNLGDCFTFTTPAVPDFLTEQFTTGLDLANMSVLFTPDESVSFYTTCADVITALPSNPNVVAYLSLGEDDAKQVTLNEATVQLFGVSYTSFYVGSNGYITFTGGDTTHTESLAAHFDQPRVSALFHDLSPQSGKVAWAQLDDRVVVTWIAVPVYNTSSKNTFQVELFFDGRIRIAWLGIGAQAALVGLSPGGGLPTYFRASDLSAGTPCGARPPVAQAGTATASSSRDALTIDLVATDDGLPDPPAALTYTITVLSKYPLYDASNNHLIRASELPYTLVNGGHQVVCGPFGPDTINDSFQFEANDGGEAPTGGASNVATVTITVGIPEVVYTFPLDEDPNWAREGAWAFGAPLGGGSYTGDPTAAHTGDFVFGYNLAGDYTSSINPANYLTTAALDCTDLWRTELRYWRWLGIEGALFDHASVQASSDNTSWTNLWTFTGAALREASWTEQVLSLSAVADGKETVYVRWGMGPTDSTGTSFGWNIDDVEIRALPPPGVFGDVNCNGTFGFDDINPFIWALFGPETYYTYEPDCNIYYADMNKDGRVDFGDINPFVDALVEPED